jgi:acetylornithine deacetylase/succinyl-diaminopimelate desuccinylase family protein
MTNNDMLLAAITKVFEILDRNQDFVVDLTRQLVGYKSINPNFINNPESSQETEVQQFLEEVMQDIGLDTTSWEAFPGRPNLVGRLPGQGEGRSLIFNGHIDVVPPGDEKKWTYDPWGSDLVAGRLYGRGTYDMKGGVAAFVAATKAIQDAEIGLDGRLELHSVVDEEAGGGGTKAAIEKGYLADAAIVAEPTDGEILPAEGGLSWVRATISGRSAHAGWRYAQIYPQGRDDAPESHGVNAIEKGLKFLQAVRELEREWALYKHHPLLPPGITTINPGVISGGVGLGDNGLPIITTNPAMIPDVCVIDFDLKFLPTETLAQVQAEFEAFVEAFAQTDPWLKDHPPQLQWHLSNINFPPVATPVDHPLVQALQDTRRQLGLTSHLSGFVAVTDAAFYAGAGVAPVIYGPTGAGLHGEDEYVEIDSLTETAKVYAGTVLQWCGLT